MHNKNLKKNSHDFLHIFLQDVPLMDVRAPIEFKQGSFPQAKNLPLLDDLQREKVGTRYKELGEVEAIKLGLELATPVLREERLELWREFCQNNPQGYLYCFRGGLRSKTTQQWLKNCGVDYPFITGGYKAMRGFLIEQFEENLKETRVPLTLLAGPTGSGKTRVLQRLQYSIDFEGIASHRGSAFGRVLTAQPSQIDWENRVSIELLKHHHVFSKGLPVIVEDEGRLIGRISIPERLQSTMKQADLIVLQQTMEARVNLIREDYIDQQWPQYQRKFGETAIEEFSEFVLGNLKRIRKRLGGERHQKIEKIFQHALQSLHLNNSTQAFEEGIGLLLTEYYDPMYHYQLGRRQGRVLFSGAESDLIEWCNAYQEKGQC